MMAKMNQQKRGMKKLVLGAIVLMAALTLSAAAQPAAAKVTLKIQSAFPSTIPILGDSIMVMADTLKEISGGEVILKVYAPGKLTPTLEIFDAVSSGALDGGYAYPGYWVGKNSAYGLFAAIPFGLTADGTLAWFYEGGGMDLWRKISAKYNIVPLMAGLNSPEAGGWYNQEINSVEDLKGLKVRWAGLGANLLQNLGVATTLIPVGEVAGSLQKGIIDGAEVGNPFLDKAFGMEKGGKYYYFPGWHQTFGMCDLLINKSKWDSLTDHQRAMIEAAARVSTVHSLARGAALQADAVAYFEEQGVEFRRYPDEVLQALKDQLPKVMKAESEKNQDFALVWDSASKFMDKYEAYEQLNRLNVQE
ncbi:MAG: TRAP transporter substrate-binding protein [Desulfobacteraceae bacterium]|nr:TRAP transporter substrate-binding protein [Desulfobacteraceae bacterium]